MTHAEQIEKALQESLPNIVEGLKKEITQSIDWQVKDDLSELVRATVTDWYKENIMPEIVTALVEHKDGLVAVAPAMAKTVQVALNEALTETLKKNLESSYNRSQLLKTLFN